MKHLEIVAEARRARARAGGERRGSRWQMPRRELERKVRAKAVEYRAFAVIQGERKKDAALDLDLSPRTLGEWAGRTELGALEAAVRGRPLKDSGRLKRNEVIAHLRKVGPGVGVARVRGVFPEMPRCEVIETIGRYRRAYIHDHQLLIHDLEWTAPGTVWAMDHAVPPGPIDGRFEAVLSVRDLSSGKQLLWQPVEGMTSKETAAK